MKKELELRILNRGGKLWLSEDGKKIRIYLPALQFLDVVGNKNNYYEITVNGEPVPKRLCKNARLALLNDYAFSNRIAKLYYDLEDNEFHINCMTDNDFLKKLCDIILENVKKEFNE